LGCRPIVSIGEFTSMALGAGFNGLAALQSRSSAPLLEAFPDCDKRRKS